MREWSTIVLTSVALATACPAQEQKKVAKDGPRILQYRLRTGDTLAGVARKLYGSGQAHRYAQAILRYNPGLDPRRLQVGQVIRLPPRIAPPGPVSRSAPAAAALRRARAAIRKAESANDEAKVEKALIEAEQALMEARRALWNKKQAAGEKPGAAQRGKK